MSDEVMNIGWLPSIKDQELVLRWLEAKRHGRNEFWTLPNGRTISPYYVYAADHDWIAAVNTGFANKGMKRWLKKDGDCYEVWDDIEPVGSGDTPFQAWFDAGLVEAKEWEVLNKNE